MRPIKNECIGGGGRRPISIEEAVRRWTRCSRCGRVVKIRPAVNKTEHYTEATIPRHAEATGGEP